MAEFAHVGIDFRYITTRFSEADGNTMAGFGQNVTICKFFTKYRQFFIRLCFLQSVVKRKDMNMINQIGPKTVETLASASKTTQAKNLGTVAKTAADKFQSSASKLISSRGGKIAAFGAATALIALAGKYVLSLFGKFNPPVIPNMKEVVNGLDCEQVSREEFMKGAKAGTVDSLED